MTAVGCFTHPSACVVFCTSGPQLGVKCKDQDYQRVYCDFFVISVLRSKAAIRFVYVNRIVDNHCLLSFYPIIVDGGNSLSAGGQAQTITEVDSSVENDSIIA